MGLFKRKEKRNADGMVEVGDNLLTALIGGSSEVTKAEALQIPTVAACVNLIADRISALPIKLYRENGKEVEEITKDNRLNMLNHDTGDTINATEMKKLWIRDYFLGKGSYTFIERNLYNETTGLFYVDETRLAVAPGADPIHKTYSIQVNGRVYFPYQFLKILRNSKGFGTGTSIIAEDPLALAIYYNTMKFENATIRKGGNKKGYILAKSKLTQDAMDKVKEAWRKLYSNSYDTKDNAVVLNEGLDFKESSSTSVELQLNENKRTNADEICKLFCMPADVLNGKADEHTISQFVQNCLMPPINTIESALDTDLLTEAEKAGHYYFAFDTSELTRGDFASRMNAYAVALQNNIYQLDEIREMEDKPPLNFNYMKLGLDTVLLDPKTGEIYTPNTDKTSVMSAATGLTNDEVRAILEARGRHWIKGEHGYFMGSVSDGMSGGGSSGGSGSRQRSPDDIAAHMGGGGSSKSEDKKVLTNNDNSDTMKIGIDNVTGETATIKDSKFTEYALNPEKQPGKAKGFKDVLGYDLSNYKSLEAQIREKFDRKDLKYKDDKEQGKLYELVQNITGPNGNTAKVLTGWIDDVKEYNDFHLTTVHLDD